VQAAIRREETGGFSAQSPSGTPIHHFFEFKKQPWGLVIRTRAVKLGRLAVFSRRVNHDNTGFFELSRLSPRCAKSRRHKRSLMFGQKPAGGHFRGLSCPSLDSIPLERVPRLPSQGPALQKNRARPPASSRLRPDMRACVGIKLIWRSRSAPCSSPQTRSRDPIIRKQS
jgi:hypothetical protein